MKVRWITRKQANAYITAYHRHHKKVVGAIFQLGLYSGKDLVAVAVVGRTISRHYAVQEVCELTRLASNGHRNACSQLYGACARIAKEMGFDKIITYILEEESGVSLRAAGWVEDGTTEGKEWKRNDGERERVVVDLFGSTEKYPLGSRTRYTRILCPSDVARKTSKDRVAL